MQQQLPKQRWDCGEEMAASKRRHGQKELPKVPDCSWLCCSKEAGLTSWTFMFVLVLPMNAESWSRLVTPDACWMTTCGQQGCDTVPVLALQQTSDVLGA